MKNENSRERTLELSFNSIPESSHFAYLNGQSSKLIWNDPFSNFFGDSLSILKKEFSKNDYKTYFIKILDTV